MKSQLCKCTVDLKKIKIEFYSLFTLQLSPFIIFFRSIPFFMFILFIVAVAAPSYSSLRNILAFLSV